MSVSLFLAGCLALARSRFAQRGVRSTEGTTQGISARRQLEHGDCLLQRTFRWRQVTQLRGFDAAVDAVGRSLPDAVRDGAFFSEAGSTCESRSVWVPLPALTTTDDSEGLEGCADMNVERRRKRAESI